MPFKDFNSKILKTFFSYFDSIPFIGVFSAFRLMIIRDQRLMKESQQRKINQARLEEEKINDSDTVFGEIAGEFGGFLLGDGQEGCLRNIRLKI
jgi:hypothetical protein